MEYKGLSGFRKFVKECKKQGMAEVILEVKWTGGPGSGSVSSGGVGGYDFWPEVSADKELVYKGKPSYVSDWFGDSGIRNPVEECNKLLYRGRANKLAQKLKNKGLKVRRKDQRTSARK